MQISYKLFPAFVLGARNELGRPVVPIALLGVSEKLRPAIFALHNLATALLAGGLACGSLPVLLAGAALLAGAGMLYGAWTLRTMTFVVLDPRPSSDPLAVLP